MKAIMVMFDSLNRHFLPNYGCDWTKLPNFERLGQRTLTFDRFYGGSMPCMPARRELHTGRYNFLHRSWSPMEPYDESVCRNLRSAGVYSHISTDHFHYWEDGGSCYLSKYDSFQMNRGQQGDPWVPCVEKPFWPDTYSNRTAGANWRHDWANRAYFDQGAPMPQTVTFRNGLDFIDQNAENDNWFLTIESFDPHEPFYSQQEYKDLYPHSYHGKQMDWPNYGRNDLDDSATEHVRLEYAALMSMCDRHLGMVLDKMDAYDLWKDTMLIVNTDHGFMLGEKEWMGKNVQPFYNELIQLPFFIHDPRCPDADGKRCDALAQTIDIPVTVAEYFQAPPLQHAQGVSLLPAIRSGEAVRSEALFGIFGGHVNITDGRYVYMRAAASCGNGPLYDYTLMPCHMNGPFGTDELRTASLSQQDFPFAQHCPLLKVEARVGNNSYWYGTRLYDLEKDPQQLHPVTDLTLNRTMAELLRRAMHESDAPAEQYQRLGLPEDGPIPDDALIAGEASYDPPHIGTFTFTEKAEKALAIYLSTLIPEAAEQFSQQLIQKFPDNAQLRESDIFDQIRLVTAPRFREAAVQNIKNFLYD